MNKDSQDTHNFETIAVRAGQVRTNEQEHCEPIFTTSSFTFASAAEAAARFSGSESGNIYSRFTNPTVRTFQDRLAALEGGEACVATSSGMAAILSIAMALLQRGDHVVCSRSVFGTTTVLFDRYMRRCGVDVDFVSQTDLEAWRSAVKGNTRLFFAETPSNPLTEILDIKELAKVAHKNNALLVVDNCFCTPALQRPLELDADIVVHSATKYLDGQGRAIGGAVVGDADLVGKEVYGFLRTAGPTMSPFNAWVFLKGLETLSLRMQAHCDNAFYLATWLSNHPKVTKVHYPGLETHKQHELAIKQQSNYGGIVSFEVLGGQAAAWQIIDSTRMISITANLGDAKSTITHPATTTHGRLKPEQLIEAGIEYGLLRVAVGLESGDDIINDLARGLGNI